MIAELGVFALILALCLTTAQAVFPLAGAWRGDSRWMRVGSAAAAGQFVFTGLAFVSLAWCFSVDDFSVRYVAENSNTNLPMGYKLAAVWGGHEGSMLLWVFVLAAWTLAVAAFSRSLPALLKARILGILGLVSVGFYLFILLTSNPFDRLFPAPPHGQDLNPLLQDPAMVAHPPMLYIGYVGFAVVFSFAVAALMGGRLDAAWARWSRPWTTVAWLFLTVGILLGSYWAYYELGWGGWWFWDPVENASFMPWLVGTALIHSLAVTEKRGAFKAWTVLLAITAFSLSLLGTFLVRSGVLTSVHSFTTDPTRGVFILGFLGVVVGASLTLYAWRAPAIRSTAHFALLSRESLLLANNLLLIVACASVLLGTLYPLALEGLGGGKISVGPPYFNTVFVPPMLLLALLLGLGPLVSWRRGDRAQLLRRMRWLAAGGVVAAGLAAVLALGGAGLGVLIALFMAGWITASVVYNLFLRSAPGRRLASLANVPLGVWAMNLAHLGMAVFIAGVAVVSVYGEEHTIGLAPGESDDIAGYHFEFTSLKPVQGPNYEAMRGEFRIFRSGEHIGTVYPEKRRYEVQQSAMTEAGIQGNFSRDLFVALGEPLSNGAWSVRIQYKPMIRWIWLGALMMALGGLLAASDRRYRISARRSLARQANIEQGATP